MGPEAATGPGLSPMDAAVHQISVLEYGCWFGAAPARPPAPRRPQLGHLGDETRFSGDSSQGLGGVCARPVSEACGPSLKPARGQAWCPAICSLQFGERAE